MFQAPAHYSFKYGVSDGHTGDQKNQWETREGDVVQGEYSLKEADGTIRTVQYTADPHRGFNAVVKKSGHALHPQLYHQEPLVHHYAPVVYHQPIGLQLHYGGASSYQSVTKHESSPHSIY